MKYVQNLIYIFKHKWYVALEGLREGVPLWVLVTHDWTKFLPSEFFAYADYFYGDHKPVKESTGYYKPEETGDEAFDIAWLHHQNRNAHHWQYWVLLKDDGDVLVKPMPDRYRREMLADWRGAGRAQGFGDNTPEWYQKNKHKMILHPDTKQWIERRLGLSS